MLVRFMQCSKGIALGTLLLLIAVGASAQNLAEVTGAVTDTAEGVIPGAEVRLHNAGTNQTFSQSSNEVGLYTFLNVQPGEYTVTVESDGFQKSVTQNIILETGQKYRNDVTLEIGALTETVTVTAAAAQLNTENGAIKGDVIVQEEIENLPLDGRDFTDLAFLVPGVVPRQPGGGPGSFASINGARADQTNFYVDGISNRNPAGGGATARPPLDSIQEFRMETSGFSAEYGGFSGGILNVTLRSGTNQYHGGLHEYFRNEVFDARGFFDTDRLKLRRNQFGGNVGGPIRLPGYDGRDKTFFHFTYEGYYQSLGQTRLGRTPTALEQAGDFSETIDVRRSGFDNLVPVFINDPAKNGPCNARIKRGCFGNTTIPASRFDPTAQALMGFYPMPNRSDIRNNYSSAANDDDNWHSFSWKFDQRISDKDQTSFRLQRRYNNLEQPFAGSGLAQWGNRNDNQRTLAGLSHTHMFSPTFIMEANTGFSRTAVFNNSIWAGRDVNSELGLPIADVAEEFLGFPRFTVRDHFPIGAGANTPARNYTTDIQGDVKFSWVKNTHTLKFGLEYSRVRYGQPQNANLRGTFTFGGRYTGHGVGDLLLGELQRSNRRVQVSESYFRSSSIGAFFNDDWKVARNLTLNLGVRYEVDSSPYDRYDRLSNYFPEFGAVVIAGDEGLTDESRALVDQLGLTDRLALAQDLGLPRSLVGTDYNNIAPRVGFAYRPFSGNGTVIRGGYGLFYQGYLLRPIRQQLAGVFPFTFLETFGQGGGNAAVNGGRNGSGLSLRDPFPGAGRTQGQGINTTNSVDNDPPTGYLQTWNFTLEKNLGGGNVLEAAYFGSKGTHLTRRYDINQPFRSLEQFEATVGLPNNQRFPRPLADFNRINYMAFGANSIYNAAQFSLRKRGRGGWFYRINYTFSRAIDDASSTNQGAQDSRNLKAERARASFDRTHVFNASGSYELPIGRNRRYFSSMGKLTQALLGDWQLSGTTRMYSGAPFTVVAANVDLNAGESQRPNRVSSGIWDTPPNGGRRGVEYPWYNIDAFERVPCVGEENNNGIACTPSAFGFEPFGFGNSGRNILETPGLATVNFAILKNFRFQEQRRLQVRAEMFNALNRVNFRAGGRGAGGGFTAFDSLTGGTIVQTGQPGRGGGARIMQVALRYSKLSRTQLGVEGAAVLKLGSLRESSKSLTTKENRREETVSHS